MTPFHASQRSPTVGDFFRHNYISAAGFQDWDKMPLNLAYFDERFVRRILESHVAHPAIVAALCSDPGTIAVVRRLLLEPHISRMANLGDSRGICADDRSQAGPGFAVFTGVAIDPMDGDDDFAMSVEGFDCELSLAPTCRDALLRVRCDHVGHQAYPRVATNQFDLNRLALQLRLVTLGILPAYGEARL